MNGQYPSTLLEKAVNEFAKLPGIGRKTAMRLVLHLLRQDIVHSYLKFFYRWAKIVQIGCNAIKFA